MDLPFLKNDIPNNLEPQKRVIQSRCQPLVSVAIMPLYFDFFWLSSLQENIAQILNTDLVMQLEKIIVTP